ncbi:hypothetical protein [Serratia quinivorans]|uniref:hypothetical protein n=1 Tax=Serratia quinivorans TaxID=137545 RepID=UPI002179790F|nr:hypothetical protein [Serratia quinivorans]CAI1236146.1 Uncharacterised protein [Serratia quinivorans]
MKLPDALTSLSTVRLCATRSDRLLLEIDGTSAWCGCYPYGICLAVDTTLSNVESRWLQQICLWFASTHAAMNDSLLLESGRLILLRRYEPGLDGTQWEAAINQQLAVADWLARHGAQAISSTDR